MMPALFFGHGNPMNALANNMYTSAWNRLGRELPTEWFLQDIRD